MVGWLVMLWAAQAAEVPEAPLEPSDQTVVYYNARLAMREGNLRLAAKLWLLRNAVEDETGRISPYDGDFGSIVWASLGTMGVCVDGLPIDDDGVGLWPLALHNWVVRNRTRRRRASKPTPFRAFDVGRQARLVSIGDVLSADELQSVAFTRGKCVRHRIEMVNAGEPLRAKLSDRPVAARVLRYLLVDARRTLDRDRVRGLSAIDARIFDIDLQLTQIAAREARRKARADAIQGRQLGLSRESAQQVREDAPDFAFGRSDEATRILRSAQYWPTPEWMTLSSERRRFLFDQARTYTGANDVFDQAALGIVDALIDSGQGAEVERWIGRVTDEALREAVWNGERGRRLLAMDEDSGFGEASVIALHRGVRNLEEGALPEALTLLAFALQHSFDSVVRDEVTSLSLRWLSYVASQFELTDELLITLQELVPSREYTRLLEDLLWSAAFRADRGSFERGLRRQDGRNALSRRTELLVPLSRGDVSGFVKRVGYRIETSPSEALRFLTQLVQRLELEADDVRATHAVTVQQLRDLVEPLADPEGKKRQQRRRAVAFLERTLALLDGLGGLGDDAGERDRARALDPSGTVFAGSVRLAPSDQLPWPFPAAPVAAPSIFEPMNLVPVEWTNDDGELVFGWRISG